jgi:hypothetical protein
MLKKILIVLVLLIVIVLGFAAYSGFFAKVQIVEKEVGPYTFIGKEYVGNYQTSGTHQDSIYQDLLSKNLDLEKGFGIYRDNPEEVPEEECRFMVGCVLKDKDTIRRVELERAGYIIQKMNVTNSMVVEFPYKNSMSVLASVMKVYPALKEYMKEKGYQPVESLEIYTQDKIYISMEIKK